MAKDTYYKVDSNKLVDWLIENKYIEKIGTGSRYNEDETGWHNEKWQADNTYNWELSSEGDEGEYEGYYLTNDFEVRETDDFLAISKHIGQDIRAGYEDEVIYIKNGDFHVSFYEMVVDAMHEVKELDN